MITDHTQVGLDCQGAQDNVETLDKGLEDIARPEIDFSEWNDDLDVKIQKILVEKTKCRILELQS